MIDYDKLKNNMNHLEIETLQQIISFVNDSKCWDLRIRHNGEFKTFQVDFLKHFFRELNISELMRPEPKFKIGEIVWIKYTDFDGLDKFEDVTIISSSLDGEYEVEWNRTKNKCTVKEHQLYSSKESLIQAQIEYWSKMLNDSEIPNSSECQHESDGVNYAPYPPMLEYKCKKCGEFYR